MDSFGPDATLADMPQATREEVIQLLKARHDILMANAEISRRRMVYLADPSEENLASLNEMQERLAPMRSDISSQSRELVQKAVNLEGLREFLPAFASGLLQFVNLELLLLALGTDEDQFQTITREVRKFIGSNFNPPNN